ncbi:MAG: hypothetical protein V1897_19705 [Pseudomonadota bacterium]
MQGKIAGKITYLDDPRNLDRIIKRVTARTGDVATPRDSRIIRAACCRRLIKLQAMFDGLTA